MRKPSTTDFLLQSNLLVCQTEILSECQAVAKLMTMRKQE